MQIKISNLSKTYLDAGSKLTVIDSISYSFPAKGSLAIVGRSGVGKSTLLHLLGGLDKPSSGSVCYDDLDLGTLDYDELAMVRGKKIGFVFQSHHLLPEFTALENVSMPLVVAGVADRQSLQQATAILEQVGLKERLKHRPSELSGGEQQRVAIARALVSKPDVILADEPTGNLDHNSAQAIQALLFDLNRRRGSVLLIVTHNLELAGSMDAVLEMLPGGVLKECSKQK